MNKQEDDDGQRRDALLRRLLKSPPLSREQLAEQLRAAKGKPKREHPKKASQNER